MVVLFKNKKRKKIIKSFITKNKAELFFSKLIKSSDEVKFEVCVENAKNVNYEIGILSLVDDNQLGLFKQDELGRNLKIEIIDSDYKIIKIKDFNVPEKIFDWSKNKRITFDDFWSVYFSSKEFKSIFTLNNKLIIQIDESIFVFSLKNKSESIRLMMRIENLMNEDGRSDGLFVKDLNTIHRKYLYDILEKNGVDKKRLYRQSTTFSQRM